MRVYRGMTGRSIQATLTAVTVLAIVTLFAPRAVVACSCIPTQPMAVYADEPETVIFTGITEPRDGRGYPVTVTGWFKGEGLAPRVWMAASSFDGNSASCGLDPLPIGSEWIFVAYRVPDGAELIVNLCAPHALVSSPEGRAMLADATATFGDPATIAPTLPPTGPASEAPDDELMQIVPAIAVTTGAALVMVLGVYGITTWWRRRHGETDA